MKSLFPSRNRPIGQKTVKHEGKFKVVTTSSTPPAENIGVMNAEMKQSIDAGFLALYYTANTRDLSGLSKGED